MRLTETRSPWIMFVYFALAVVFAFFAVLVNGIPVSPWLQVAGIYALQFDFHWFVWLLASLSLLCLLPLFDAILYRLSLRNKLPQFLMVFYHEIPNQEGALNPTRLRNLAKSLGGRLVAAGLAIFAVLYILSGTIAVREREVDSALFEYMTRLTGRGWSPRTTTVTVKLFFVTKEQDGRKRLQSCLAIIQDLKLGGAKAVLIDVRGLLNPTENYDLLMQIENTGIAVFGLKEWQYIGINDSSGESLLSRGTFTIQPHEIRGDPFLFRLKPEGFPAILGEPLLDLSMEVIRKYDNYPRNVHMKRESNKVVLGNREIPIGRDGWMYARNSQWLVFEAPIQVSIDSSLNQRVWGQSGWAARSSVGNAREIQERFRDKIVFLQGVASPGDSFDQFLFGSYRSALQAIITGGVISRPHTLYIWITLLCILAAGLVAFKLRPLPSILVIFALGLVVLIACWFLYDRFNVLVDIFYPLFAIVMSMFVFPAITVAQKMEEDEEAS